ncbi:MAG: hypothetical protein PVG65_00990 [Candidatus Thorarchaeota archaeon]|jgi:hypothetical protein
MEQENSTETVKNSKYSASDIISIIKSGQYLRGGEDKRTLEIDGKKYNTYTLSKNGKYDGGRTEVVRKLMREGDFSKDEYEAIEAAFYDKCGSKYWKENGGNKDRGQAFQDGLINLYSEFKTSDNSKSSYTNYANLEEVVQDAPIRVVQVQEPKKEEKGFIGWLGDFYHTTLGKIAGLAAASVIAYTLTTAGCGKPEEENKIEVMPKEAVEFILDEKEKVEDKLEVNTKRQDRIEAKQKSNFEYAQKIEIKVSEYGQTLLEGQKNLREGQGRISDQVSEVAKDVKAIRENLEAKLKKDYNLFGKPDTIKDGYFDGDGYLEKIIEFNIVNNNRTPLENIKFSQEGNLTDDDGDAITLTLPQDINSLEPGRYNSSFKIRIPDGVDPGEYVSKIIATDSDGKGDHMKVKINKIDDENIQLVVEYDPGKVSRHGLKNKTGGAKETENKGKEGEKEEEKVEPKSEEKVGQKEEGEKFYSAIQLYKDMVNYIDGTRTDGSESNVKDLYKIRDEVKKSMDQKIYEGMSMESIAEKMKVVEHVKLSEAKGRKEKMLVEKERRIAGNIDGGYGDGRVNFSRSETRYAALDDGKPKDPKKDTTKDEKGEGEIKTDASKMPATPPKEKTLERVVRDPLGDYEKNIDDRLLGLGNPHCEWEGMVRAEAPQAFKDIKQAEDERKIKAKEADYARLGVIKRGTDNLIDREENSRDGFLRGVRNRFAHAFRNLFVDGWHRKVAKESNGQEMEAIVNGEIEGEGGMTGDGTTPREDTKNQWKNVPGAAIQTYGAVKLIGSLGGGGGGSTGGTGITGGEIPGPGGG